MKLTKKQIAYLASLSRKKIREKEQKYILEGWRAVEEALNSDVNIDYLAVTPEEQHLHNDILGIALRKNIPLYEITKHELERVSDTVHSQGVVALVHKKVWQLTEEFLDRATMLVACDRINDPGNLGTIIRSCDWFGVDGILLGNGCVSVTNEKVVRATVGSLFHLPIVENVSLSSLFSTLKKQGWTLCSATLAGTPIDKTFRFPQKVILLVGSEAHGVHPDLEAMSDFTFTIPSYGKAESLNVGVACSILLMLWRMTR